MTKKQKTCAAISLLCGLISACSSVQPIATMQQVNLDRFMGKWYVIACIPTLIEKDVYNGVETYTLNSDGTIDTVFTFNKGGFNGEAKRYNPKGFVVKNTGNAVWGMQFIWPIKAEYRISYVDEQYQQTIIARSARDYVWLMARTPKISDEQYSSLVKRIQDMGYDSKNLVKIPQQ
ncbi:MAG TPA: lipocalin family protein [Methylophilaceae bacterium]|jgi:apolipoprotein D and lipocalin family protein